MRRPVVSLFATGVIAEQSRIGRMAYPFQKRGDLWEKCVFFSGKVNDAFPDALKDNHLNTVQE